jgi:hypothetical protein
MEPEGSIPNSQELSTCSYPDFATVNQKVEKSVEKEKGRRGK